MLEQSTWFWSLTLILGFPLLVVLLSEAIERLERQGNPLSTFLRDIRGWVLPPLALWILMQHLLKIAEEQIWLRGLKTLCWLAIIYALVSLLNILLTSQPYKQQAWQIRVPNLLFQVARATVIFIIFSYLLTNVWKIDISRVAAALGVGSLVMALALQDTLSNLVSGFLLIIEGPFKVGDWILVEGIEGEVIEINWRAVRLKTWDRDIIIIPNGNLGKETICNYSLNDPAHAVRIPLKFSYFDPPNRVKQILEMVAISIEGILADPRPDIRPTAYNSTFIEYEAKFFIRDFSRIEELQEEFLTRVYYAAKRHRFNFPFADKMEFKIEGLPVEAMSEPAEVGRFLQSLPYLSTFSREAINELIHKSQIDYYGAGEQIIQTGDCVRHLYILLQGEILLSARDKLGRSHQLARLTDGALFGEMVLLPGEPSPFAVTVMEDVRTVVIAPEIIMKLVQRHAKLFLEINHLIDERRNAASLIRELDTRQDSDPQQEGLSASALEQLSHSLNRGSDA